MDSIRFSDGEAQLSKEDQLQENLTADQRLPTPRQTRTRRREESKRVSCLELGVLLSKSFMEPLESAPCTLA